jgi:hypothetical protein
VALDARRRHQGGEAVEQLERRQDLRATSAGTAENSPNFPSKKIVINAFLKDGRLGEHDG